MWIFNFLKIFKIEAFTLTGGEYIMVHIDLAEGSK